MHFALVFSVYGVLILPCALARSYVDRERVAELRERIGKEEDVATVFADFKNIFKKRYTGKLEEDMRRQIFGENVASMVKHNVKYANGEVTYKLGINKFTDLTHDEFRHRQRVSMLPSNWFNDELNSSHVAARQGRQDDDFGCCKRSNGIKGGIPFSPTPNFIVPETVDWRTSNYVTSVKDQGECGACWAFSSVGAIEGQVAKITNTIVDLSVQQLVDCVKENGCDGGRMTEAFKYIKDVSKGIASDQTYPYTGNNGKCRNYTQVQGTRIRNYGFTTMNDEEELKQAVAEIGPISVGINTQPVVFREYIIGVLATNGCTSDPDHAVLIVGYGTDNKGAEYWLIKNSWGNDWGEDGYMKLARNNNNMCGVAKNASYPMLSREPSSGSKIRPQLDFCWMVTLLGIVVTFFFFLAFTFRRFRRLVAWCCALSHVAESLEKLLHVFRFKLER